MQFYCFAKRLLQLDIVGFGFFLGEVVCFYCFSLFIRLFSVLCGSTSVQRKNQSGILTSYAFSQGSSNESTGLQLSSLRENFHATMKSLNMVNNLNCCSCKGLRVKHKMYPSVYIYKIWGMCREHFPLLQQEVSFNSIYCKDTSLKTSIYHLNVELYSYVQIPFRFLDIIFV